jgi:hypothetical protein
MANTKKTQSKPIDTNTNIDVDIESLIKDAVNKAILETSQSYENKIKELMVKTQNIAIKTVIEPEKSITMDPNKMVKIMHMSPGGATFKKGRINIRFENLFDSRPIRWEILDEMYWNFINWFNNCELVILDKDVREYYNIEYIFNNSGADKDKFYNMLSMDNNEMIKNIDKLSKMVSLAFLKFFIQEYLNGNTNALKNNNFSEIQKFYKSKYNITDLQESITDLTSI